MVEDGGAICQRKHAVAQMCHDEMMMRHVMIQVCKTSEADKMRKRTPNERKLSNVVSPTRLSKDIQLVFFARSLNLERAL